MAARQKENSKIHRLTPNANLVRLGALLKDKDSEISQTITASNLLEKAVVLESVSSTIKGITAKIVGGVGDPVSTDNRDPESRL